MVHSAAALFIQVWPPRARKKNKKCATQLKMISVTGMNQDIQQSNTRFWLFCPHKEGVCVEERKLHFLFWWRGLHGTPLPLSYEALNSFFFLQTTAARSITPCEVRLHIRLPNKCYIYAAKDKKFTPSCSNNGSNTRCEWWVWRGADMQICKKKRSTLKKRTKRKEIA